MSTPYDQVLDATIQHLEDLKSRGVRFVPVSSETLQALAQPSAPTRGIAAVPQSEPPRAQVAPVTPRPNPASTPPARPMPAPIAPKETRPAAPAKPEPPSSSDISVAPAPALPPEEKAAAFAALRERVMACVKCPNLAASRKNVVFGVGNINADLMFVGEAPGADEDEQAEPFVGKAGQLLTRIIETMGLQRGDVYIGNILKCRPDTPGQSAGNRKPTSDEMKTCISYLHEQIDIIRPRVLVALGATAVEGLLDKSGISKLRGQWQTYRGIPLMPTYHPAYLLRNQALAEKRKVWEDMLKVMEKLGMQISEKQRNFFMKGS